MSSDYTKSVMRLSLGFFCVFLAFNTTQALVTTLITDQTLAYASLGTLYGVFTLTTVFAPKIVDILGPRIGMMVGATLYVLFVLANIYPKVYLLIPASAGVGFGAGILWTSQGIYLSRCSIREAASTGENVDTVTAKMNSIFWTMFQFNGAVGLIISSIILGRANDHVFSLSEAVTYMFIGFGALGAVGIFVMSTLANAQPLHNTSASSLSIERDADGTSFDDDLESRLIHQGSDKKTSSAQQASLMDTLSLITTSPQMILLIPAIFACGAMLGFSGSSYPLLWQDIENGPQQLLPNNYVGYQAATFYLANSLFSYFLGRQKLINRRSMFSVTLITLSLYFMLVIMRANGDIHIEHGSAAAWAYVFALPVIFAMGDCVLESQIPTIIQSPSFFPDERQRDAANSALRMVQSIGFCFQYGMGIAMPCKGHPVECRNQALILLPLLVFAVICVFCLHLFVRSIEATKSETKYAQVDQ